MKIQLKGNGPILMVDNDDLDFELFQRYYLSLGSENPLIHLPSGIALLAYFDAMEKGLRAMPAMVFLDVNMPKMDGFETLAALRARQRFIDCPIALLTGSDTNKERELAQKHGVLYFVKPMDSKGYLELLQAVTP